MRNATLRFLALVVTVFLIGGAAPVQGQGTFAHGAVVALQDTPHLWFADEHGILHWGGDTRALAGKHIVWSNRVEVSLEQLRTLPVGDPWLTAGLLKDGDPIYLVKWETDWPQPQLLHIQSIKDVELFGINGSNYGNFVIEKNEWERRFGISVSLLTRDILAAAVTPSWETLKSRSRPIKHRELHRNLEDYIGATLYFEGQLTWVDEGWSEEDNRREFRMLLRLEDDPSGKVYVYLIHYGRRFLVRDFVEVIATPIDVYSYRDANTYRKVTLPRLRVVAIRLQEEIG